MKKGIMKNNAMAFRPYLEKVEKTCSGLRKDELIGLILRMAEESPPDMRQQFLDKLQQYLSRDSALQKTAEPGEAELLHDNLQSLRQNILDRIESIENGAYWDDPDDDDWKDKMYYDDDPDLLSESHTTQLAAFFDVAGDYFLHNRLPESRRLYKALFDLVGEINRYGQMPDIEVDVREAHARYCRAVYELSGKQERVPAMLTAMAVKEPDPDFENIQGRDMALLQDVIDAQLGTMPDMQEFLAQWEKALAGKGHRPERLARLRLEAAYMLGRNEGIAKLVRSWKDKQPLGYVVWLQHLVAAQKWERISDAATEALEVLPMGPERRFAAVNLAQAGQNMHNDDLVLEGKKEAFRSSLDEHDLLLLMDEANRLNIREKEMAWSLDVLRKKSTKKTYNADRLLAKLYLMAGDLKGIADLCKNEKVYGWSGGSPGALFFCAMLHCMAGKHAENCVLLEAMLTEYTQSSYYFDAYRQIDQEPVTTFVQEIKRGLAEVDAAEAGFTKHIATTLRNGEKRIDYIVSNKHRNAYGRAASVLGAMAEMHTARGNDQMAKELVHTFYFKKYNRFPAFRKEVRDAVAGSPMLKKVREMLG